MPSVPLRLALTGLLVLASGCSLGRKAHERLLDYRTTGLDALDAADVSWRLDNYGNVHGRLALPKDKPGERCARFPDTLVAHAGEYTMTTVDLGGAYYGSGKSLNLTPRGCDVSAEWRLDGLPEPEEGTPLSFTDGQHTLRIAAPALFAPRKVQAPGTLTPGTWATLTLTPGGGTVADVDISLSGSSQQPGATVPPESQRFEPGRILFKVPALPASTRLLRVVIREVELPATTCEGVSRCIVRVYPPAQELNVRITP
jgi:hypothetical protein